MIRKLLTAVGTALGLVIPVLPVTSSHAATPAPELMGPPYCQNYTATMRFGADMDELEHWASFIMEEVDVPVNEREDRIYEIMDPIDSIWLCLTPPEIVKANDLLEASPIAQAFGEAFDVSVPTPISPSGPIVGMGNQNEEISPALRRINVPVDEWESDGRVPSSQGVEIAILDTGVDAGHDDLNVSRGYNCTHDARGPEGWGVDFHGHGTAMASIVAAKFKNNRGLFGVMPGASIISIPVLGIDGSGSSASVLCGVSKALEMGATIASLSLGGSSLTAECDGFDPYTTGFCRAIAQDLIVVASAGNDGIDAVFKAPANMPGVVTVSALGDGDGLPGGEGAFPVGCELGYYQADDALAFFSNWGSRVEFISPGVCILVALPGNMYGFVSGTSPATPFVTGVLGAAAALYPGCRGPDLVDMVHQWSSDPDWTEGYGDWTGDKGPDKEPLIRYVTVEPSIHVHEDPCELGDES